ncbi:MAG: helix-turn-helix transcriptional regulator [Microbacterium gubbeenense]|uniref:helix-turn-helix transcriptional regulator n=1 Tax=Microbacterium gubbeenense TaxID=159896 RepID=UPI0009FCC2C9
MPRREIVVATALLRAELDRQWRIEDLAREVAVSPTHLTRLFHAQIGISPAALLRQLRADRLAELLATTNMTISAAGAAVGWHDLSTASRSFKQRYGIPPSAYANSYRSPGAGSLADSGLIH